MTNPQRQEDSYGSTIRDGMKHSMEHPAPFVRLNRRSIDRRDSYDGAIWFASWVVGILIFLAMMIVVTHQLNIAVKP